MNDLKSIPKEIGQLTKLINLDLSLNDFSSIPNEVCNLKEKYDTLLIIDNDVICIQ